MQPLQVFIKAVEAQRGNKLTNAQADELITAGAANPGLAELRKLRSAIWREET